MPFAIAFIRSDSCLPTHWCHASTHTSDWSTPKLASSTVYLLCESRTVASLVMVITLPWKASTRIFSKWCRWTDSPIRKPLSTWYSMKRKPFNSACIPTMYLLQCARTCRSPRLSVNIDNSMGWHPYFEYFVFFFLHTIHRILTVNFKEAK